MFLFKMSLLSIEISPPVGFFHSLVPVTSLQLPLSLQEVNVYIFFKQADTCINKLSAFNTLQRLYVHSKTVKPTN